MSKNLQEAIVLMRDMTNFMDPEEDYLNIIAIEEESAAGESRRKEKLDKAHSDLKALTKARDAARKSCVRPASVLSAEAHATFLNEHDVTRLQLAKSIHETEGLQANQEAELTALKDEARTQEDSDPAFEHQQALQGTALRARLYRGLGFQLVFDKDGPATKMLVRAQSGDVHTIDLGDKSEYELANQLWTLASA